MALRGLGDPDAFLPTDLGVRRAISRLGRPAAVAALEALGRGWRPWRSYAVAHLWHSLTETTGERAGEAVPA
ncbi:MAG: hypothetical protein M0T80_03250 [Actinomycetota bacterium]|nr:hypothetical protein [Actinomycetota bacterium]